MSRACRLSFTLLISILVWPSTNQAGEADSASYVDSLKARYHKIESFLQSNQYNAPIFIESDFRENAAVGEVYALLEDDFELVASKLSTSDNWCDVLLLHVNVKGCLNHNANVATDELTVFIGRNFYQTPDDAYSMRYHFEVAHTAENYLQINMISSEGPFGTSDYRLTFEAIPFGHDSTFMHLKYSYHYGALARLALDGYLATLGRNKVGFTVKAYDENHNPVFVKGLQGIVERNSMRYFLAIQTLLDTATLNRSQWSERINRWYHLAEPFSKQLIEVEDGKYLETKQQEYSDRDKSVIAPTIAK